MSLLQVTTYKESKIFRCVVHSIMECIITCKHILVINIESIYKNGICDLRTQLMITKEVLWQVLILGYQVPFFMSTK